MKLSVFSTCLNELDRSAMLAWLQQHGVKFLELGCGAYPGTRHADVQRLVGDAPYRRQLQADLESTGIHLAALSCHGNPLHPQKNIAQKHHTDLLAAIDAARLLSVPVVVCFSGQSGDSRLVGESTPNWPILGWPEEFAGLREQQWERDLIPYWRGVALYAEQRGIQLALEMHGGFAVHNPASVLRLREACGSAIGANLDPSHLWWQGMEPLKAVEMLGSAIFHVHLKDTVFNAEVLAMHGIFDTTAYAYASQRSWRFGVPGEGHDATWWRAFVASLEQQKFAGVMSVEVEALVPPQVAVMQTLEWMRAL